MEDDIWSEMRDVGDDAWDALWVWFLFMCVSIVGMVVSVLTLTVEGIQWTAKKLTF